MGEEIPVLKIQIRNNSGRKAPNRKVVLLVPYMTINGTNYAKKGFTVPQGKLVGRKGRSGERGRSTRHQFMPSHSNGDVTLIF